MNYSYCRLYIVILVEINLGIIDDTIVMLNIITATAIAPILKIILK